MCTNKKIKYLLDMKRIFIVNFFLNLTLFTCLQLNGQETELPVLAPVSPNAAALARFGSYAVNTNLGKTNISVPIYSVKSGSLELPIAINYNSSGIRLNERASWVGLGWNLQAGGAIIRNIKGIPDGIGDMPESITNLEFNESNFNYLYDAWRGFEDDKPDQYILNAYGVNATFYFIKKNGIREVVFESNNSIKVTSIGAPNYGIQVVIEDGTVLVFNDTEISKLPPPSAFISYRRDAQTAYYLSKVIAPNKKDTITFEYKRKKSFEIPVKTSDAIEFHHASPEGSHLLNQNFWNNRVEIDKCYLDKIIFKNGYMQFESSLDRLDLNDEYRLVNMKVFFDTNNNIDQLVKEIHLNHSYYKRGPEPASNDFDQKAKVKSLKLESLTIGALTASDSQKFEFEYDQQLLPSRGSSKQDFWGYINDNNEQSLIPLTTFTTKVYDYIPDTYTYTEHTAGNANRDAHPTKMKSGILTKITYPTGGYTEFEFEANQYDVSLNTPINNSKSKVIQAIGSGDCTGCFSNGKQSLTFTIDQNPLGGPINGKLSIYFTDAYSGSQSSNSYAKFSGLQTIYKRSGATTIYPATEYIVPINLTAGGTYTIEAEEFGHGSNPPSYVPSVTARVSWDEPEGYVTINKTKYVGGLRIKSIKNYNGVSETPVLVKNYSYSNPNIINQQKSGGYVKKHIKSSTLWAILSSSPNFENGIGLLPSIEYGIVTESDFANGLDNGKKVYTYENVLVERDITDTGEVYKHPLFDMTSCCNENTFIGSIMNEVINNEDIADKIIKPFKHGFIKKIQYFKYITEINGEPNYSLVSEEEYNYDTVDESNFNVNYIEPLWNPKSWQTSINPYGITEDLNSINFYFKTRKTYLGKKLLTSKINREYDLKGLNPIETITSFKYNNNYLLSEKETTDSEGITLKTKTYYPKDITGIPSLPGTSLTEAQMSVIEKIKTELYRINIPIQTETYKSDVLLSRQRTNFKDLGNDIVLPEIIQTSKGLEELQDRIVYHNYDANGNPLEVSKADGTSIYYIWGYSNQHPIAKIENFTSSQAMAIQSSLISPAVDASNNDISIASENILRTKLDQLRNHTALSNAMVTTYTYDPLIGVTSITDPKGYTIYYKYDAFNRLEYVKDAEGNILSKNEYNYKQ
ncbi:RHS repeat domain-containing protein [Lutibacter sp. HS1-25]|uniref:RHS repeat domain-containing protein n=1 Tax=Lutibacter sp. HS1-25 TaxID=2485000 RepID=UPI0010125112|nr:RHS repeat domain-containing protein [Lutibacter sp. HS1-25]